MMTASEMGRKGGKARMASMSSAQRRTFARMGVAARRRKAREARRGVRP